MFSLAVFNCILLLSVNVTTYLLTYLLTYLFTLTVKPLNFVHFSSNNADDDDCACHVDALLKLYRWFTLSSDWNRALDFLVFLLEFGSRLHECFYVSLIQIAVNSLLWKILQNSEKLDENDFLGRGNESIFYCHRKLTSIETVAAYSAKYSALLAYKTVPILKSFHIIMHFCLHCN